RRQGRKGHSSAAICGRNVVSSSAVTALRRSRPMFRSVALAAFATVSISGAPQASADEVQLASAGKGLLPVVVGPNAGGVTKQKAAVLADYLGRITGAKFEVKTGDGSNLDGRAGIAVGTVADFPSVAGRFAGLDPKKVDPTLREDYLLESHENG